jgi:hypothetical protein
VKEKINFIVLKVIGQLQLVLLPKAEGRLGTELGSDT